jgi:hypothetical protein
MTKKTPENFAKAMMLELSNLRAYIEQIWGYQIAQMAQDQGKSPQQVSDALSALRAKRQRELYGEMLKFAQMGPDKPGDPSGSSQRH